MKVLFLPEVRRYFADLSHTLYDEGYFGFEDSAIKYVRTLFKDIEANLPNHVARMAPSYFDKYGTNMRYAVFRKNKATLWYVFFTEYMVQDDIVYLVRFISNNHVIASHMEGI